MHSNYNEVLDQYYVGWCSTNAPTEEQTKENNARNRRERRTSIPHLGLDTLSFNGGRFDGKVYTDRHYKRRFERVAGPSFEERAFSTS